MDDIFYRQIIECMSDGVYFVDRERRVTFWNNGAERLSGFLREEVVGKSCAVNILSHCDGKGNELCLNGCPLAATMNDGLPREGEIFMHHKEGHRVPVFVRASPVYDKDHVIVGAVEVFSNDNKMNQAFELIERLQQEVLQDGLTGLGNRRFADVNLDGHILSFVRQGDPFGLLIIDIDHFKKINDTYGHNVGDEVIRMVAKTIANGVRALDIPCRWGGEEFVIILPNATKATLSLVADRIRALVEKSWFDNVNYRVQVTVSLGGVLAREGDNAETVVSRADAQLYISKKSGRNRVSLA